MYILINCVFHFLLSFLNVDFNIFAQISTHNYGNSVRRRLQLNGYRYGIEYCAKNHTVWKCTSDKKDSKTRCSGSVITKTIYGYEMAKVTSKKHTCRKSL